MPGLVAPAFAGRALRARAARLGLLVLGALSVCGVAASTAEAITFTQPMGSPFGVGGAAASGSRSIAVGNFNAGPQPDLVIANFSSDNVSVLSGNGAGGFSLVGSPTSVFAGGDPRAVAVSDFNGDGNADVATANQSGDNVSVLLGNGAGGFGSPAPPTVAVGDSPVSLAVGDFNGDSRPDFATANSLGGTVAIRLGDGAGNFSSGSDVTIQAPLAVAVGDFNGDGKPDLAVGNAAGQLRVLLGDGPGSFTQAASFAIGLGRNPFFVAVGDFNGDGKPDVATANRDDDSTSVLLHNGTTGFTQAGGSPFSVGDEPLSVAVGDLDGDGKTDLATANVGDDDNVTVLKGDGTGGFSQPTGSPLPVGLDPFQAVVGDLNGDGKPDLAAVNQGTAQGGNVSVLLNGETGFAAPAPGSVLVSELRLAGPGGAGDQFVELYNTSTSAVNVGGWSLQGSNGQSVPIPHGTLIPPLGHLLLTGPPNLGGSMYSLNDYGPLSVQLPYGASGNLRIPANGGVRLVSPQGTTIDAVGFTGAQSGFFEGTKIPQPPGASGEQVAFVRRSSAGAPVDTNDNNANFVQVNAGPVGPGQSQFGSPLLGAPAPQGLFSPTQHNDILQSSLLDPAVSASASPNLIYTPGSPGTVVFNRKLTNCSGQPATGVCANSPSRPATTVTRLRFRISDLTTIGTTPSAGKAILRAQTSTDSTPTVSGGGMVTVKGLPLDVPPSATNMGGVGSSFTATAILPGGNLTPGESVNVQFRFLVNQTGEYRFAYDSEDDLEPYVAPAGPSSGAPSLPAVAPIAPATSGKVTATSASAITKTPPRLARRPKRCARRASTRRRANKRCARRAATRATRRKPADKRSHR